MDILKLRAHVMNDRITWTFEEPAMQADAIAKLDLPADIIVNDGDIWHVRLISSHKDRRLKKTVATVQLVARVFTRPDWLKIDKIEGHWLETELLRAILIDIHQRHNILLIGDKGVGKTTLCHNLARVMKAEFLKVDMGTFKHGNDLFGSDAATEGSTKFARSAFLNFLDRAIIAEQAKLETMFIVLLDELNRVHGKNNQSLQGMLDWTRQVTITTTEGSTTIKLPKNLVVMATINHGPQYQVFQLDPSLVDRFSKIRISQMPIEVEEEMLANDSSFGGIDRKAAKTIVAVARNLRLAARGGQIDADPSYRDCQRAASYRKHGMDLYLACQLAFLEIFEGNRIFKKGKVEFDPNSPYGKAHSALHKTLGPSNGDSQPTKEEIVS